MATLTYGAICSLDGFIEDESGKFDWAEPNEDVHSYINALEANHQMFFYGRKLYETMVFWENEAALADMPEYIQEYGRVWRAAEKIVFSRSLATVSSERTSIRRSFDPDEIRSLKVSRGGGMSIGGAELAGEALRHGLVDQVFLFVHPVVVGGGKPALARGVNAKLTLTETKTFGGVVMLRYLA